MFSIFIELFVSPGERIEQAELGFRREQRLVVVWAMKIDEFVAELFQDRQGCWRTIDKLPSAAGNREAALDDQVIFAWLNTRLAKFWIECLQVATCKNGFHCAKVGTGSNQRFISALPQ